MFVHGTPLDPLTGLYTEAIKEIRRQFAYRHVFSAHTHSPGIVGDDGDPANRTGCRRTSAL